MSHVTEPLMHWLTQNADRAVTVDEICEATALARKQVHPGLARLAKVFPQLERKTSQVFVWHSKAPEKASPDFLLLRVVRRKEDSILAVDEDSDTVYVVREIQF